MEKLLIRKLKKISDFYPSQWDGQLVDGRFIYIRYMWGKLNYGVGDTIEKAIEEAMINQAICVTKDDPFDGVMDTDEMLDYLKFYLETIKGLGFAL